MLPLLGQLTPGSPVMRELAEPAPDCRTRFLVFPATSTTWSGRAETPGWNIPDLTVRNVPVSGVGHLSMPNNSSIAFTIASALTELDPFETPERSDPA